VAAGIWSPSPSIVGTKSAYVREMRLGGGGGGTVPKKKVGSPLPKQRCGYLFLTAKIPEPLVWVAIAVWSQLEELLVPASQPDVFGPFGRNWSSL
jgi:hypothetical protein